MAQQIKKVVLAYSGGLDTSIIIPWLKENYDNCEVIAVSADLGQEDELEGLNEKAIKTGASKLYIEDMRKELIEEYIWPTLKANAAYEGRYLLGTSFARPLIAKRLVEIAKKEGADAICHGCTGKGNDQVRFELSIRAFDPDIKIVAPWREWDIKSREEEIDYAEAHNIPLKITRETNYSKDKNLWHLSHEGLDLEDPANEPKYNEILEFSELEEFINFPVKNYSSGMLAKLGFSIATVVNPDILIIDEILSVGDVKFQKKSNDKIKSLMGSGTTVLLVSHSIQQIRNLCDKALWINEGKVVAFDEVNKVCDAYLKAAENASKDQLKNIKLE